MPLTVLADAQFDSYYRRLLQVFLYVTDECNLRCQQCYYMPWLKNGHAEMPTDVMIALLKKFRSLGAIKLSLLGGEPSLYGQHPGNEPIGYVVQAARELGFTYVRMVSNGMFTPAFLDDERLHGLDEITFSIDGDTAEIHDSLRGPKTFERSLSSVMRAIDRGFNVHITTCVHAGNIGVDSGGQLMLDRAIHWATGVGARLINFHPLFKMGIARDSWTGDGHILPEVWANAYALLRERIDAGQYSIPVRLPQRFISAEEFARDPRRYGFCPVKLAERIEVHPNGQIHSCALHNGTPVSMATFARENDDTVNIRWSSVRNELTEYPFDQESDHPCVVMQTDFGDRVPLCISFKPDQEEFIWKTVGLS